MMKKFLSLLLVMAIVFAAAGICYATEDEEIDITDEETAGSPETVDIAEYEEGVLDIMDDSTPGGAPTIEIAETKLPAAGGISAEIFYAAGALLIIAALVLVFARRKVASEN